MKIVVGLLAIAAGVWCAVDNWRLAERNADVRWPKFLSRKASVRVSRVLYVLGGLYLVLFGIALIGRGWKEFK